MSEKKSLDYFQKQLYNYLKNKALSYESEVSHELEEGRLRQRRYFNKSFSLSSVEELFESISKSQITYLGDFHSFDQNSKNLERLLKKMANHFQEIIIGVEIVEIKHQTFIDHYLEGHITELEFLESIDYKNSWKFPWTHYNQFFKLAKEKKWKIIALNSDGNLDQRDSKAAKVIAQNFDVRKVKKMLILFGELHILPEKIPLKVATSLSEFSFNQTIIHQNIDQIYWKLKKLSDTQSGNKQIVKFNEFEYSLQTSPPWIKYESMIYWYENFCSDPEFDLHEYILETGSLTLDGQATDNFAFIVKHIAKTLEIKLDSDQIEDFNLYDSQRMDFLHNKVNNSYPLELKQLASSIITRGIPFKLPGTNEYYCSSYSINRLAYLAGLHIHSIMNNNSEAESKQLQTASKSSLFLYYVYHHASGYLSSKLINPFRKCDLYLDFVEKEKSPQLNKNEQKNYSLAKNIIDVLLAHHGQNCDELVPENASLEDVYLTAKHIGFFLGEIAFAYLDRQKDQDEKSINLNKIFNSELKLFKDLYEKFHLFLSDRNFRNYKEMKKRPF